MNERKEQTNNQQEAAAAVTSGRGGFFRQMVKVGVALTGLVVGGGIVGYLFKGLLRGTSSTLPKQQATVEVLDDSANTSLVASTVNSVAPLAAVQTSNLLQPTPLDTTPTASAVVDATVASTTEDEEQGEENSFSTDDVRYRVSATKSQEEALESTDESQAEVILGTANSSPSTYRFFSPVSTASASNGWGRRFYSDSADSTGESLVAADVDNDGKMDIVVGSPVRYDRRGATRVIYDVSSLNPLSPQIDLTTLSSQEMLEISGETASAQNGQAVAVGYYNSDTFLDIASGSPSGSIGGTVNVFFGAASRMSGTFSFAALNGTNGFRITGDVFNGNMGSVLCFGKVRGGPYDDLLIGGLSINAAYLVPASSGPWPVSTSITDLVSAGKAIKIVGASGDRAGCSLAAFDFNRDGKAEIFIGACDANGYSGAVYMLWGNATFSSPIMLANLPSSMGIKFSGSAEERFGRSVGSAGRISGDRLALVIGATSSGNCGAAYVILEQEANYNWTSTQLINPNGYDWFKIVGVNANSGLGGAVGSVGRVNGDAIDDFAVGAMNDHNSQGSLFVIFGRNDSSWTPILTVSDIDGINGVQLRGQNGEIFGCSVAAVPVIANSSYSGFAVGACNSYGNPPGAFYLINTPDNIALVNNSIDIYQGQKKIITREMLAVSHAFSGNITTTFALNNIQGAHFTLNNTITDTFTSLDVDAGLAAIVPNDSPMAPEYSVQADDTLVTCSGDAVVRFVSKPFFNKAELTVNQAQMVQVDSNAISAGVIGADPDNLMLYFTSVANGHFATAPNFNTNINSVIQGVLNNGTLFFVADDSPFAPSFSVVVSDGRTNVTTVATVHFAAYPIWKARTVTIGQGGTIAITSSMIRVDDYYIDPNQAVILINNIEHGAFTLRSNQSLVLNSIVQNQIVAGNLVLRHDGSTWPLRANISASNGLLATPVTPLIVNFYLQPYFATTPTMRLGQGVAKVVTPAMVNVADPNTNPVIAPNSLKITTRNVSGAIFDSVTSQGVPRSQFTYAEMSALTIRVVPDGSETIYFEMNVANQIAASPFVKGNVTLILAPTMGANHFAIAQSDDMLIIRAWMFNATDRNIPPTNLQFLITNMRNGQFIDPENPTVAMQQFSPADIAADKVAFVPYGGILAPSCDISVTNGETTSEVQSCGITFYRQPTVTSRIIVNQGQRVVLTPLMLSAYSFSASDLDTIIFTLSEEQYGNFVFCSNPNIPMHNFTQQHLINSSVCFMHDGSQTAPFAYVSVSDGFAVTNAEALLFDFDTVPQIINSRMSIRQGEKKQVTSDMLSAINQYSNPDLLKFNFIEVQNGQFLVGTVPTTVIIQEQFNTGMVDFEHDGSSNTPRCRFKVSDGRTETPFQDMAINFTPATLTSDILKYTLTGAGVSAGIGIVFWLYKIYQYKSARNSFAGASLHNRICYAMLDSISLTSHCGSVGENSKQEFSDAVNKLIEEINKQYVDFAKRSTEEQAKVVQVIVEETARIIVGKRGCCYKVGHWVQGFCYPEVLPQQIKGYVYEIAEAVTAVLKAGDNLSAPPRVVSHDLQEVSVAEIEMVSRENKFIPPSVTALQQARADSMLLLNDLRLSRQSDVQRTPSTHALIQLEVPELQGTPGSKSVSMTIPVDIPDLQVTPGSTTIHDPRRELTFESFKFSAV